MPARQARRSAGVLPRLAARLVEKNPVPAAACRPCALAPRSACAPPQDPTAAAPSRQDRTPPSLLLYAAGAPRVTRPVPRGGNACTTCTDGRSKPATLLTSLLCSPQPEAVLPP